MKNLYAETASILDTFMQLAPQTNSKHVNALLLLALSHTDLARAERMEPSLPGLVLSTTTSNTQQTEPSLPPRNLLERAGFQRSASSVEVQRRSKRRKARPMRRPPKTIVPGSKPDPERWVPIALRSSMKDLPERRKREMRRLRSEEQAAKRKAAEKRKLAETAAAQK
jgi:signal recognition particle subunit SRP72